MRKTSLSKNDYLIITFIALISLILNSYSYLFNHFVINLICVGADVIVILFSIISYVDLYREERDDE